MRIDHLASDDLDRFRRIRLAALRDSPAAFGTTLERASKWTESDWREVFGSMVVFVAVLDGEDVGMVRGKVERGVASLGSVWVRPDARRLGIAHRLLAAVITCADTGGFDEISLQVGTHQEEAVRLYERAGFEIVGDPIPYPPPNTHLLKVTMARALAGEDDTPWFEAT
jgi:ribosomal protein S18 acetylase RimI-like enzyme